METESSGRLRTTSPARLLKDFPGRTPVAEACFAYLNQYLSRECPFETFERLCLSVAPQPNNRQAMVDARQEKVNRFRYECGKKPKEEETIRQLENSISYFNCAISTWDYWHAREVAVGIVLA